MVNKDARIGRFLSTWGSHLPLYFFLLFFICQLSEAAGYAVTELGFCRKNTYVFGLTDIVQPVASLLVNKIICLSFYIFDTFLPWAFYNYACEKILGLQTIWARPIPATSSSSSSSIIWSSRNQSYKFELSSLYLSLNSSSTKLLASGNSSSLWTSCRKNNIFSSFRYPGIVPPYLIQLAK